MRASHHGSAPHLLDPAPGDVPVVVDVVVVEDHRRRHGREQPADVGLAPGLAVEPRVLLEVGDLLARRLARVAARADELERRRRDLVGVDLVAEQQQPVGPLRLAALQELRVRPERVDALLGSSSATRRRARPAPGRRPGTSRTRAGRGARGRACGRPARGRPSSGGHTTRAVEPDLVRRHRAGSRSSTRSERVVVPLDGERPRSGGRGSRPRTARSSRPRSVALSVPA